MPWKGQWRTPSNLCLNRPEHGRRHAWPNSGTIASRTGGSPPDRKKTVPLLHSTGRAARPKENCRTGPGKRSWTPSRPDENGCLLLQSQTAGLPFPNRGRENRIPRRCLVA
eukprot:scaffold1821_cov344-Pavlova_lutheri.AAC.10